MSKVFLDTNILAYPLDRNNQHKGDACRKLMEQVKDAGNGVISTQVMQEFYVTVTQKMGVSPIIAKDILTSFENFEVVTLSPSLIQEAIDCQVMSRVSFWDALIIVAASSAKCEVVWSEDFNPGQTIRGVRIENPFKVK